jgi:hypothetical protein
VNVCAVVTVDNNAGMYEEPYDESFVEYQKLKPLAVP